MGNAMNTTQRIQNNAISWQVVVTVTVSILADRIGRHWLAQRNLAAFTVSVYLLVRIVSRYRAESSSKKLGIYGPVASVSLFLVTCGPGNARPAAMYAPGVLPC
ncbi:hypothetical protein F5X98DRAFT_262462 [Xylaria grammica]|nr:hypothetical protein F5X98DRAFT_262462 [Xylaria grammica]